ncbi:MAG: SCP2 sterol-binding domain-containing protein [Legionellales bacterium]|nr:SCP2 sterol-binding domain-containing protein [Legionellales bacterium]
MYAIEVALPIINKLLNQYLQCDPESLTKLSQFSGKSLKIIINSLDIHLVARILNNQVVLSFDKHVVADSTIEGSALHLLQLLKGHHAPDREITIKGDMEFAQQCQIILANLQIDWEEQLAKITGDVVAHQISYHAQKVKQFFSDASQRLQSNLVEYLQHEIRYLVSALEINDYCQDVTILYHDVERLQARIRRLQEAK